MDAYKVITGQERVEDQASPLAALVNFYTAFNQRRYDLMEANWLQTDEASMSNPLGGLKRGWKEISSVYRTIFGGEARVYVEFYDYTLHASETMFLVVGREQGTLEVNKQVVELAIRTSRIFTLREGEWRQLHHHGSMDNPELLASYQRVLLNK